MCRFLQSWCCPYPQTFPHLRLRFSPLSVKSQVTAQWTAQRACAVPCA
jgi:hypothetical protein